MCDEFLINNGEREVLTYICLGIRLRGKWLHFVERGEYINDTGFCY